MERSDYGNNADPEPDIRYSHAEYQKCIYYENMPIQTYLKILQSKKENFQIKKFWYFSYFCSKHRKT